MNIHPYICCTSWDYCKCLERRLGFLSTVVNVDPGLSAYMRTEPTFCDAMLVAQVVEVPFHRPGKMVLRPQFGRTKHISIIVMLRWILAPVGSSSNFSLMLNNRESKHLPRGRPIPMKYRNSEFQFPVGWIYESRAPGTRSTATCADYTIFCAGSFFDRLCNYLISSISLGPEGFRIRRDPKERCRRIRII